MNHDYRQFEICNRLIVWVCLPLLPFSAQGATDVTGDSVAAPHVVPSSAIPIAGRNRRRRPERIPSYPYPKASNDYVQVAIGTQKVRLHVLANDRGHALRLKAVSAHSANGGSVFIQNNKLIYLPPTNYSGKDYFWYQLVDVSQRQHSAKVTVCICVR